MGIDTDTVSKIAKCIDRLAHTSTTDQDAMLTVFGLRRVANGRSPSELLFESVTMFPKQKEIVSLKKMIVSLRFQIAELEICNAELKEDCESLEGQINSKPVRQEQDDYTHNEVVSIIFERFGRYNGIQKKWTEYSAALHAADSSTLLVTANKQQIWRKVGYPAWAVAQLNTMPVIHETKYIWSPDDIDYLCQLYLIDSNKSNCQLAAECSVRFGFRVNDNSIKGKLHMLQKTGRIQLRKTG